LQRASEGQGNSPETLYLLGLSYVQEKKPDAALAAVQARLEQSPNWAEGYQVAGDLMRLAGRYPKSEALYRQAVSMNPKLASSWLGLGDVLTQQTKFDEALQAYGKVIEQSPKSAGTYMRIGQLRDKRGDWTDAERAYQKVLELEPEHPVAKNNLAWDYAEHGGNVDVALRLAQEASQAKPDDAEISDTLGWIYLRKNAPGDAIQVLKQSVAKSPKSPEYNYHLGIAYLRAGRKTEAKQFLEATLNLEPKSPYADDTRKMLASITN
jgi:tetratricopeptide (TPR) repeat protein